MGLVASSALYGLLLLSRAKESRLLQAELDESSNAVERLTHVVAAKEQLVADCDARAEALEAKLRAAEQVARQGGLALVPEPERAAGTWTLNAFDALAKANPLSMAPSCATLSALSVDVGTPEVYVLVKPERLPKWVVPMVGAGAHVTEKQETHEERMGSFVRIFRGGLWSRDTPSGTGSMKGEATDRAILTISSVLDYVARKLGRKPQGPPLRMLDVPCGDMNWMPGLFEYRTRQPQHPSSAQRSVPRTGPLQPVHYTGIDIVPDLIARHKARFAALGPELGNAVNMTFRVHDIVDSAPADLVGNIDLAFSRQMLQHLGTEDSVKVIRNIRALGAKFLLTTTYPDWLPPRNVPLEGHHGTRVRKLNLNISPFDEGPLLPLPTCWDLDFSASFLALYEL